MLEPRSVDINCVQEIKFRRKSVRIISPKRAEYKLLWRNRKWKGLKRSRNFLNLEMGR